MNKKIGTKVGVYMQMGEWTIMRYRKAPRNIHGRVAYLKVKLTGNCGLMNATEYENGQVVWEMDRDSYERNRS